MTPDERAYELLKWQSLAPMGEFDPTFPYFDVWKKASDKALSEFEEDHPPKERNDEIKAYLKLVSLGVIPENEYYSPTKAYPPRTHQNYDPERWKGSYYTRKLTEHAAASAGSTDQAGITRRAPDSERTGEGLAFADAQQGVRVRRPRRRKRC